MLEGRADALRLHPGDQGCGELAGEGRVLGEVLEVAPAQRRPLDVHARTEEHGDLVRAGLAAESLADARQQLDVPGRAEGGRRREAGGRHAVVCLLYTSPSP